MPTDLDFIHQFIPGSSDRTLLLLHGTGGDENDLIPLGRELDPAAALLSPRGKVLENGYPRFFRRLAEGVFDLEDLKQRTDELADFVVAAAEHYHFDARKLVAVGYSNGANVAASILLRRPGVLPSAILLRAMVPFIPEELPNLSWSPGLDCGWNTGHDYSPREHRTAGADADRSWRGGHGALLRRGSRPNEYRARPGKTLAGRCSRPRATTEPLW